MLYAQILSIFITSVSAKHAISKQCKQELTSSSARFLAADRRPWVSQSLYPVYVRNDPDDDNNINKNIKSKGLYF